LVLFAFHEVFEEESTLGELYVLVYGLSETETDLLQVQVAKHAGHLFGVKRLATIPSLSFLFLVKQRGWWNLFDHIFSQAF
jgi:hypothetical protein